MDPDDDKLEKDPRILDMLRKLRAALGTDAFDIVDHWHSDLIAVGIASPKNHHVLIYIGIFDDGYYAELELPPTRSDDSLYEVAGRNSGLGFEQLVDVVAKHLSLGSTIMDDNPKNKDGS